MKVFICGQKSFGKAVLCGLLDRGHTISGVAVPPPGIRYDTLHVTAIRKQVPVIIFADRLREGDIPPGTDLIVAAHSHHFIGSKTRTVVRHGAIGFHPSLLPRHRGRDAVRWTIKFRDPVTGGTVYRLNDRIDGGPVLLQRHVLVNPRWNYHDLWRVLFPMGVDLLCETVSRLERGPLEEVEQDERLASWEPPFNQTRLFRPELIRINPPSNRMIREVG